MEKWIRLLDGRSFGMSENFHSPDAIVVGPESTHRLNLVTLLQTLGIKNVYVIDRPEESRPPVQLADSRLIFISWEIWSAPDKMWFTQAKPFNGTNLGPKAFLIIPPDHAIDLVGAIKAGIDGYITFPYSLHNLRQKIHTVLPAWDFLKPQTNTSRFLSRTP